ncbi:N-formylglutamate amidohydrolase [Rhodohalobacter sp. SW132]|uniref:N-formylglutamate amidohydrolase n=1 Tax=Rhodohalobacter sp. SW132 TaxID=2293433 RepID=UPI000E21DE1C|nr:N-formylglutamate amidohydrolase [Rhodohalobacter sp. SW132]REL33445.1 N-formylglutamate amidohydrolase [Rhodohalobacter sp. SW132]
MQNQFIISCEHASNAVPEKWSHLFEGSEDVLDSHRGWDPGAVVLAERVAEKMGANLHTHPWTRLLIEPNRSKGHRSLFSQFTKSLPANQKSTLMENYWLPYRENVRDEIEKGMGSGYRVIHISVHTFTPVWEGTERNLDIGLLYDPKKKSEQAFCRNWKIVLDDHLPELRVRMNRPYLGSADGLTSSLRKKFESENYLGIEIEVNQKHWFTSKSQWDSLCKHISESLSELSNSV